MHNRRWLALIITALYLVPLLLSGCAPKEVSANYPELVVSLPMNGSAAQIARINAALNVYLEQQLGIHVALYAANDTQSAMRMINARQELDLTYCSTIDQVEMMQSNEMLLPLDDLLAENGSGILQEIPATYYDFSRIGGSLYAMPTNKERFRINVFEYNRTLAEQYGLDLSEVHNIEDLTAVFAALRAQTDEVVPIALVPGFLYFDQVDTMGDSLGVLAAPSGQTVVNLYETAQFSDFVQLIRSWYLAGYLYPDTGENDTSILYYLQSGKVLGCITTGKPGFAVQEQRLSGCDLDSIDLGVAYSSADTLSRAWYAIPVTAKDPALSMQLMQLLYSDAYVANLLIYGIEGEHYRLNDSDQVIRIDGSDYAGVNPWAYCNAYRAHTEQGLPKTYWQDIEALNHAAADSPAWGFSFDPEAVSEEVYRCEVVKERYLKLLYTGSLGSESLLCEFQAELRAAGIDRILTEKQRQLDAYIKEARNG